MGEMLHEPTVPIDREMSPSGDQFPKTRHMALLVTLSVADRYSTGPVIRARTLVSEIRRYETEGCDVMAARNAVPVKELTAARPLGTILPN